MSMHGHPTFPLLQPDVDETDSSASVIYSHHTLVYWYVKYD